MRVMDNKLSQIVLRTKLGSRNSVKISRKKIIKMKDEILQYYDNNGYLSWSEKKRKYVILGTNTVANGLVPCPECKIGKLLVIHSRQTKKRFIGCSNYHNGCRASAPLIQRGMIYATKKSCDKCSWPLVLFRYSRKQKWTKQCCNMRCITRSPKP